MKNKCLNPNCKRTEVSRGLCAACYGTACRLVHNHITTWKILIKKGKCNEAKHGNKTLCGKIQKWMLS